MLQEYNPLEGRQNAAPADSAVALRIADDCARFVLRIDPQNLDQAGAAFGATVPAGIGKMDGSGGKRAICVGPDEWLLHAPVAQSEMIRSGFAAIYPGFPHSLVETSDREVGIALEGEAAELALNSACPLNLGEMPAGSATRTVFDTVAITLIKESDTRYRIEVWRSFATHVWDLLAQASRELSLEV